MTRYTNVKVNISEGQKEKLRNAIKAGCSAVSIRLGHEDLKGNDILAVTNPQAKKLAKAYENGKGITIRMSANQLKHNTKIEGGFLGGFLGKGLQSYGNGLYLKQGGKLYDGKGLLLGPNSPFANIPILGGYLVIIFKYNIIKRE